MAHKDIEIALLRQLKEPFDPKFIKWRVGQLTKDGKKATALAYLDAREVYKRLDDVCGIGGWSDRITEIKEGFICELSIRMPDGSWVTKSDAADYTEIEAIKGGASSALKRAAAVWGVGRYLYYLPRVWVPIDEYKSLTQIPELPDWALPSSNIERWEDLAEMQLEAQQDDEQDMDVATVLREAVTLEDIGKVLAKIPAASQKQYAPMVRARADEIKKGALTNE